MYRQWVKLQNRETFGGFIHEKASIVLRMKSDRDICSVCMYSRNASSVRVAIAFDKDLAATSICSD